MPVRILVTEGARADCKKAVHLIEGISAETLLADQEQESAVLADSCVLAIISDASGNYALAFCFLKGLPSRSFRVMPVTTKRMFISGIIQLNSAKGA